MPTWPTKLGARQSPFFAIDRLQASTYCLTLNYFNYDGQKIQTR